MHIEDRLLQKKEAVEQELKRILDSSFSGDEAYCIFWRQALPTSFGLSLWRLL